MLKINSDKIRKAEIAIAIPSYNEADSISYVARSVDKGLQRHFKNKKAVIINADNNSPDNTKDAFLKTETKTPKIYISTLSKGKGRNLINFFSEFEKIEAEKGATVDGDLKSIGTDWMRCLLSPVFRGYDYLTPVYYRSKYNGTITNSFCYPLVYGLLGKDIRQPIGGDVSFSKKMVRYWKKQKVSEPVKGYGIDIFMTLCAIKSDFKLGQVNLGSKVHKPSALKLDNMFLEVGRATFDFLIDNENLWQKEIKPVKPPLVSRTKDKMIIPKHTSGMPNFKKIEEKAIHEFENVRKYFPDISSYEISNLLWLKINSCLFESYRKARNKKAVMEALRTFYFLKVISFLKEVRNATEEEAEAVIQKQARQFFKERNRFLKKQ